MPWALGYLHQHCLVSCSRWLSDGNARQGVPRQHPAFADFVSHDTASALLRSDQHDRRPASTAGGEKAFTACSLGNRGTRGLRQGCFKRDKITLILRPSQRTEPKPPVPSCQSRP